MGMQPVIDLRLLGLMAISICHSPLSLSTQVIMVVWHHGGYTMRNALPLILFFPGTDSIETYVCLCEWGAIMI